MTFSDLNFSVAVALRAVVRLRDRPPQTRAATARSNANEALSSGDEPGETGLDSKEPPTKSMLRKQRNAEQVALPAIVAISTPMMTSDEIALRLTAVDTSNNV